MVTLDRYRIWLGPNLAFGSGPDFMSHTFYEYEMEEMSEYTTYLTRIREHLGMPYVVFTEILTDACVPEYTYEN